MGCDTAVRLVTTRFEGGDDNGYNSFNEHQLQASISVSAWLRALSCPHSHVQSVSVFRTGMFAGRARRSIKLSGERTLPSGRSFAGAAAH